MEPIQFIKEVGFYAAAFAGIAWFIKRDVWPYFCKQLDQRTADAQERHLRMLALLDKLTDQVTTQRQASIDALHALTVQMTELAATVANVAHLVQTMSEHAEHRDSSQRHRQHQHE